MIEQQAFDFHDDGDRELTDHSRPRGVSRRSILASLAGLGIGSSVFHRALAAEAAKGATITVEMVKQAEWISGLELTDDERKETADRPETDCRFGGIAP